MHTLQFTFIIECLRKINNIIAIAQVQPLRIYSVGRKHDVNALRKQLYRLPFVAAPRKHDILTSFELSAFLEKAYFVQILDIDNNLFPAGGNFVNQRKQTFDLVFIDADKRLYSEYFDLVFPMVRAGGLILADNTLWDGHVVEEHPKDKQTLGILSFNDKIKEDPRIEKVILPLRDGLTMIWKK